MTSPTAIPTAEPSLADRAGRRQGFRLLLVLGALTALGPVSIDMYLPALPSLTHQLSTTASAAQLTLTACLAGLGAGQLVAGPISDAHGRKRPILAGVALYVAASVLCMLVPSVGTLIVLRLVQGLAGGVGIVIARAVVGDRYHDAAAARFYALLMAVAGAAPILAPLAGAQLLHLTSWRGIFAAIAGLGLILLAAVLRAVPETLPADQRQKGGTRAAVRTFGLLCSDRVFTGHALAAGLAFAAMFAYIAGSPFVLEGIYGLSAQEFSAVFALNALGIVAASHASARLAARLSPTTLLAAGLTASAIGGAFLLVATLAGLGLAGVLPSFFFIVAGIGLTMPNATVLALSARPAHTAGGASALLGTAQFALGGTAAPLVGIAGQQTGLPMAVVVATLSGGALVCFLTVTTRSASTSESRSTNSLLCH